MWELRPGGWEAPRRAGPDAAKWTWECAVGKGVKRMNEACRVPSEEHASERTDGEAVGQSSSCRGSQPCAQREEETSSLRSWKP